MLPLVPTDHKVLDEYLSIIGEAAFDEIRSLAEPLRGKRVLHFNATPFGGGVVEILKTLVPLMNDIGLEAEWRVMRASDELFTVTKTLHNSLQGQHTAWTKGMWDTWLRYNEANAQEIGDDYDLVVVHDPQPAAVLGFFKSQRGEPKGKWIWRCHIDLTQPQEDVWERLLPHVSMYDAAVFSLPQYVKGDLTGPEIFVIPPGIDPLSPKSRRLAGRSLRDRVQDYGVDPGRPMIVQVSRYDPWKDPLGVIDVYRMAKQDVPGLQLVLVASMAADDPQGWDYYEKALRHAGEDEDIHFFTDRVGAGNDIPVNTFQTAANVVLQKSTREGFGLTVSEALWKGTPVIGGAVGGIPLQVIEGQTGYLVRDSKECAEKVCLLLKDPALTKRMGQAGREHVRREFLTTRVLRDYLRVFGSLQETGQALVTSVAAPAGAAYP